MMHGFVAAHGYDPGPSQRPLLSGAISGILATVPAIGVLVLFGSLKVEADILGMSPALTLAAGCVAMAISGAAYARFFGRAANAVRGGRLRAMGRGRGACASTAERRANARGRRRGRGRSIADRVGRRDRNPRAVRPPSASRKPRDGIEARGGGT